VRPAHLLTLSDYLQQRSALETVGAASIAALIDEPVLLAPSLGCASGGAAIRRAPMCGLPPPLAGGETLAH